MVTDTQNPSAEEAKTGGLPQTYLDYTLHTAPLGQTFFPRLLFVVVGWLVLGLNSGPLVR